MKHALFAGTLSFALGMALQRAWIGWQNRFHVTQTQKSYGVGVDTEVKAATPAMGGVVFIVLTLLFLLTNLLLTGYGEESVLFWALPLACGGVGFLDDWLKFRRRSSEGLASLQKLAVQFFTASVWVVWALSRTRNGFSLWPGLSCPCPPWVSVPLIVLAVVGMMNAVNVTDGLDGLAGGAFMISLGVLGYVLPLSLSGFLPSAFAFLFGMGGSFLFYNVRPARTFMGDAGSHFLGGALAALCVQGGAIGALLPAGFLFGIELLSSAVQIFAIRGFGRKVFKMAPLHHHFQRLGWDETAVTSRFLVFHALGAAFFAALLSELAEFLGAGY
ncbi:MAG: phospho-N-acetylmuramoyl-pentapeptide-transferase [Synergistaceae bacterium]|jgi:phospho-N-acetylmuramoyl-pentapeptide-transferase|nr:phospho-N-acetylmuramoyl-pentapeptide-transferase [Synergistaceae bacterium]